MGQKPPAFQFYAKDWRSSMNVQAMSHEQRGIFIDMMAIAWDSEEPGTITLSDKALCRELRIFSRTLRQLLADFPATWRRVDGKLVQPKLREQWLKYQDIQQKRSSALQVKGGSASASAFAFASANQKKEQPQTPNPLSLSLDQIKTQLKNVGAMPRYAMSERAVNNERNRQRERLKAKHPRLFA